MSPNSSDAVYSNAGDEYHFLYIARRMLDMLHPRSNLSLIAVEGFSSGDMVSNDVTDSVLGVDLTEYYGGTNSQDSEKIIITQVKYSSTKPNDTWTLKKLSYKQFSNKSSVIAKLAKAFDAVYKLLEAQNLEKVTVQIYTNQLVEQKFHSYLEKAKKLASVKKLDSKKIEAIHEQDPTFAQFLIELKVATRLSSWQKFNGFLVAWNLQAFGQDLLTITRGRLLQELTQFRSGQASLYTDRLMQFVRDRALPNRNYEIYPDDVYMQLGVYRQDFFPAPYDVENLPFIVKTKAQNELIETIDKLSEKVIIVHGVGGTGKSTLLQQFADEFSDGEVVVYDCFAKGTGLKLGGERYPYKKFLTQITNEIDHLFKTEVFANRRDDYNTLIDRFYSAIRHASDLCSEEGKIFVIVIDAIDNAIDAERLDSIKEAGKSFVNILPRIISELPENCFVIASCRTENRAKLPTEIQELPHEEITLTGFGKLEAMEYLKHHVPGFSEQQHEYLFEQTNGNPRILSKLVQEAKIHPQQNIADLLVRAKQVLEDYYQESFENLVDPNQATELLALCMNIYSTMNAPGVVNMPDVDLLSAISGYEMTTVIEILEQMYFGLRVTDNKLIEFRDQDFYDFSLNETRTFELDTRQKIADFCIDNFEQNHYAKTYIAQHLFLAERFNDLIVWALSDQIRVKQRQLAPFYEDILVDYKYAYHAALELSDFLSAFKMLTNIASLTSGSDLFMRVLLDNVTLATSFGYHDRLLEYYKDRPFDGNVPKLQIKTAKILAGFGEVQYASELISRGIANIRNSQVHSFDLELIEDIAIFYLQSEGFDVAIRWLLRIESQEAVLNVYDTICYLASDKNVDETLQAYDDLDIEEMQQAFCLAGFLRNSTRMSQVVRNTRIEQLASILDSLASTDSSFLSKMEDTIGIIILLLVEQQASNDIIKRLLPFWLPAAPQRPLQSYETLFVHFLRRQAIEEIVNGIPFIPADYEITNIGGSRRQTYELEQDTKQLRKQLSRHYLPSLALIQALSNADEQTVYELIKDGMGLWDEEKRSAWYRPNSHIIAFAAEALQAVTKLETRHDEWIDEILNFCQEFSYDIYQMRQQDLAKVLAHDPRYHYISEKLLIQYQDTITNSYLPARERVEALLDLSNLAISIGDQNEALRLFEEARQEADTWSENSSGRIYALIQTARSAQKHGKSLDSQQLLSLQHSHRLMSEFNSGEASHYLPEILRILAHDNLPLAIDTLRKSDRDGYARSFEEMMIQIGLGLLDKGVPVTTVQILVHFSDTPDDLYKACAKNLAQSPNQAALEHLCRHWKHRIVTSAPSVQQQLCEEFLHHLSSLHVRNQHFEEINSYIDGLSMIPFDLLTGKDAQLSGIDTVEIPMDSNFSLTGWIETLTENEIQKIDFSKLARRVREESSKSTRRENITLIRTLSLQVWDYNAYRIAQLISEIAVTLPSRNMNPVFDLIQIFVENNFKDLVRVLLYTDEGFKDLIEVGLFNQKTYSLVLELISQNWDVFRSDQLFRLVGVMAGDCLNYQVSELLDIMIELSIKDSISISDAFDQTEHDDRATLLQYICDLLGDPRFDYQWRAVYALVDALDLAPDITLPILFERLEDTVSERWMTIRENILFALLHFSLHSSEFLTPYVDNLLEHACNKVFPHAKIREFAKQILLNIIHRFPDTLSQELIEQVLLVNEPIACVVPEIVKGTDMSYQGSRWSERSVSDDEFSFDLLDTMPYWFSGLAHCFALHRCHVADAAIKWVNEWGYTNENCRNDYRDFVRRFPNSNLMHRQGSYPEVMVLERYIDHHCLQLVAGEFIDTRPVYVDDTHRSWDEWRHYRIYQRDPSLTSRFLTHPPIQPEYFGVFDKDFSDWINEVSVEYAKSHLLPQDDWLILSANMEGRFDDREFTISIDSILAPRTTSYSLALAVEAVEPTLSIVLPYWETHHLHVEALNTFENESEKVYISDYGSLLETSLSEFKLSPSVIEIYAENAYEDFDPKWKMPLSRHFSVPSQEMSKDLERIPLSLDFVNEDSDIMATCDQWHVRNWRGRNEYSTYTNGYRLRVKMTHLMDYLRQTDYDLVTKVRVIRRSRNSYRSYNQSDAERSTQIYAFVVNEEGILARPD